MTRLESENRQLQQQSVPRIDYASEDSDLEDPEDLRLVLSPATMSGDAALLNGDLADVPLSSSPSPVPNGHVNGDLKGEEEDHNHNREEKEPLGRRVSQSLADAFLEQLPEVQSPTPS